MRYRSSCRFDPNRRRCWVRVLSAATTTSRGHNDNRTCKRSVDADRSNQLDVYRSRDSRGSNTTRSIRISVKGIERSPLCTVGNVERKYHGIVSSDENAVQPFHELTRNRGIMKTTVVILVVIVAGTMGAMASSFYFMANPLISTVVMTTSQTETQQNYIILTEKTRTSTSNSLH